MKTYKITSQSGEVFYKDFKSIYQVIAYYDKVLRENYEIEKADIETERNQDYADAIAENSYYDEEKLNQELNLTQ